MRTRQLEAFVRVCDVGSISKAATLLHIAQPALSAQMSALERELGLELFVRSTLGVTVTPAGQYFLDETREVLNRLLAAKKTAKLIAAGDQISLTIGMTPGLSALLSLQLAEELGCLNPSVEITFVEHRSEALFELASRGDLDLVMAYNMEEQDGVFRKPLVTEQIYFITSAQSDYAQRIPIELVELAQPKFVIPSDSSQVMNMVKTALAEFGMGLHVAFRIASMQAIKDIIRRNAACAILPYAAVAAEVERGELLARPIVKPALLRTLYISKPSRRPLSVFETSALSVIERLVTNLADRHFPKSE